MTSSTLADSYQPLMTKLVQESLVKLCVDNLPITDTSLQIDGIVCISLGKDVTSQIVVKIHKFLEKATWSGDLTDARMGDSNSPWGLQKGSQEMVDSDNPVDLTGAKHLRDSRSILQYTSERNMPAGNIINNHGATTETTVLVNGGEPTNLTTEQGGSSATYQGPIPVPRVKEQQQDWTPTMLNKLSQLQPTNYKPLPHLKLKSPVKTVTSPKALGAGPDKSQKDLLCKICSQICFGGLSALQAHTQEKHRRYVCRFCYNTFSLRCNLKRHERLHVGVKPYNCKVCNKSFARSTDLKLHMHKHGMSETDVIVPCPRCPRSFLSVQNLRWHLYKVHKETDATYACTICEKLFIEKEEYMRHREEHTAENLEDQDGNFIELGPDDSLNGDSDNDQLYIDTQSEGTLDSVCMDDEIVLPRFDQTPHSVDSFSSNSNEPRDSMATPSRPGHGGVDASADKEMTIPVTSTPNDASGVSTTGSRKRKRGNPVKHVEEVAVVEEDVDIDNMYYNSPLAKKQQARERPPSEPAAATDRPSSEEAYFLASSSTEEPQDLSNKQSKEYRSVTPSPVLSPALSQIQEPVALTKSLSAYAMPAQGYINKPLSASWDSNTFKNLKGALTGATQGTSLPGHRTPEPFNNRGSYSPLTLPILITPTPDTKSVKTTPKSIKSTPDTSKNVEFNTSAYDDPNREFQCSELGCNEVFLGFSAHEDHCMTRHGRYPCKYCRQTFSGKNNRTRHMRCHVGAKVYTCPDCFKNFSRPDSMREHQFIHTLSYQEDKCRNCGWAFDKKNLLLAHLKQCYRHKMETGKSTKLIDETPAYLNNDVDFKPLYPVKMEAIPILSVEDGTPGTKNNPIVPTVVPSGTDTAVQIASTVNSLFKHVSGDQTTLSQVLTSASDMTQKNILVPISSAPLPLNLLKQNYENASPKSSSLSSPAHSTAPKRVSPLTISLSKLEKGKNGIQSAGPVDSSKQGTSLVVPNLNSLLPTPLVRPVSQKPATASPGVSPPPPVAMDTPASSGITNISNLVVPNVSSAFSTSLNRRASPSPYRNQPASPIVIVPESSSPLPMTSSSLPVVLSANAAAAAVTAVSTAGNNKDSSSSTSRPQSPYVLSDKTTPVPSIPAISSLSPGDRAPAAPAGHTPMPSLISPSASRDAQAPVNNVLAAVKNLVKSRTSPTVMDQNANKTPSLQSNSDFE